MGRIYNATCWHRTDAILGVLLMVFTMLQELVRVWEFIGGADGALLSITQKRVKINELSLRTICLN